MTRMTIIILGVYSMSGMAVNYAEIYQEVYDLEATSRKIAEQISNAEGSLQNFKKDWFEGAGAQEYKERKQRGEDLTKVQAELSRLKVDTSKIDAAITKAEGEFKATKGNFSKAVKILKDMGIVGSDLYNKTDDAKVDSEKLEALEQNKKALTATTANIGKLVDAIQAATLGARLSDLKGELKDDRLALKVLENTLDQAAIGMYLKKKLGSEEMCKVMKSCVDGKAGGSQALDSMFQPKKSHAPEQPARQAK